MVDNNATSALMLHLGFVLATLHLLFLHARSMSTFVIHVPALVMVNVSTDFGYKLVILGPRDKGQGFWNVNVPCDLLG